MVVNTKTFTTGPAVLPDVGIVAYNGCTFSPLFETTVNGVMVKDSAGRTVKYMEYTITVDGYVTLPDNSASIGATMNTLRLLLSQQGGEFTYQGRGCDITTTPAGLQDVAWGPEPKVIDFQPLGAGRSAKIKWQVVVRMPEVASLPNADSTINKSTLLQFCYDTTVTYGEDGYSSISCTGSLEISLNRHPKQSTRTLNVTAYDFKSVVETRLMSAINLYKFRITKRNFKLSQDKRTLEWSFEAEEKPWMDLPEQCTIARGNFSVRQAKQGLGNVSWLCTLRVTYTVRKDRNRRNAWIAFLKLLRLRMQFSIFAPIPKLKDGGAGGQVPAAVAGGAIIFKNNLKLLSALANPAATIGNAIGGGQAPPSTPKVPKNTKKPSDNCQIMDFNFDEGLYLDSKTVTFSCTWRVITEQKNILLGSGLWAKLPETDANGDNLWVTSMQDMMGADSWLTNKVDPNLDVIVDFGGP